MKFGALIGKSLRDPNYTNAVRAFVCMLPMLIAILAGKTEWVVPLGQGGFFSSTMPVASTRYGRLLVLVFMMVPGLGLYLIGGNSASNIWLAVTYALAVGFACSLLTGFRYLGMVAIAGFIPIYTAGLNAGSPEKAASSFVAFSIVVFYCNLINLLPFWKVGDPVTKPISEVDRVLMGVRLSLGEAIALGISMFFNFGKLGWAPSAVGSVVRADTASSKIRSWIRAGGVIIGAVIASIALAYSPSFEFAIFVVIVLSVINGLYALTPLGQIPILYNAVILILYSQTGSTGTEELVSMRIVYNLIGILIAIALVYYPLPYATKYIKSVYNQLAESENPPEKRKK